MANVAAGTIWNLPNYHGELFTADMEATPLLSMIGGLTGGQKTNNFEFPTSSEYEHETVSQPDISETDSLSAPTAISYVRDQNKNVVQIHQEQVSLSYVKQSNMGRLSGINTAGSMNNVVSEKDWQISMALKKIARDVEHSFLNGAYQIPVNAGVSGRTRGLVTLCATGSTVPAGSVDLSKALLDELFLEMWTNGAIFELPVIFCGGFQKQKISDIYGYAPEDRNIGGVNIKQIETDFGNIGIANPHKFMPAATLLVAEISVVKPVFQEVPGKGLLFYEDLSKAGAADSGQIFGQIGLNHGPQWMHGTITGLTTS